MQFRLRIGFVRLGRMGHGEAFFKCAQRPLRVDQGIGLSIRQRLVRDSARQWRGDSAVGYLYREWFCVFGVLCCRGKACHACSSAVATLLNLTRETSPPRKSPQID